KQLFDARQNGALGATDPAARCIPGMPKLDALPYPFKIVETPGIMVMLFEGFTTFRQIFTDGRALPKDPQPAWYGYSTGKWDGDRATGWGDSAARLRGVRAVDQVSNAGNPANGRWQTGPIRARAQIR